MLLFYRVKRDRVNKIFWSENLRFLTVLIFEIHSAMYEP